MNKQEYVAALRELADFVESKPLPDEWKSSWGNRGFNPPDLTVYVYDKKEFGEMCVALGSFQKSGNETFTSAHIRLPLGATIDIHGNKHDVCEKVVVGKRTVLAQPETYIQAEVIPAIPEHEEDVFEWKCPDSFLELANK